VEEEMSDFQTLIRQHCYKRKISFQKRKEGVAMITDGGGERSQRAARATVNPRFDSEKYH